MNRDLAQFPLTAYWCIDEAYAVAAAGQIEQHGAQILAARGRMGSRYADDEPALEKMGSVAVIGLAGPMTRKETCASWWFGGASTEAVAQQLQAAHDDPSVTATILRVSSPGGEVAGTADLADVVHTLTQDKPIYAYVEDQCCSAAWWVASQCAGIIGNTTAIVGSMGVVYVMRDTSRATENAGVKVHVFSTSDQKGAGTPGTPLTDSQRAEFQRMVDEIHAEFVTAVMRGRSLSADQVAPMADARVHVGKQAQEMGFLDGIQSFDGFLADVQQKHPAYGVTYPYGTNNTYRPGTGKEKPMRASIAGAFAALGMNSIAARILGAIDDNPGSVASATADGIKAEVASQVAASPVLAAAKAAGVETPEAMQSLHQRAGYGDTYINALRDDAKKQATVAFGVTTPEGRAQVEAAHAFIEATGTPDVLKATITQYGAVAQAKGLQQANGSAAARQTTPAALMTPGQDAAQAQGAPAQVSIDTQGIYANRAKAGK